MGCLGQIIIVCPECKMNVEGEGLPFWEWMRLPMVEVERAWQAVLEAVK